MDKLNSKDMTEIGAKSELMETLWGVGVAHHL